MKMNDFRNIAVALMAVVVTGCASMSSSPGKPELMIVGGDEKVSSRRLLS